MQSQELLAPIQLQQWRSLHPKVKQLWRISGVISGVMSGLIFGLVDFFITREIEAYALPPGLIGGSIGVILLVLGVSLADLKFKNTAYMVGEDDLAYRRGIWWKHERFVNRARVQHVDITTNFIAKFLGLTEISVHVGGMATSAITISGLVPDEAEDLRRRLLEGSMIRYMDAIEAPPVAASTEAIPAPPMAAVPAVQPPPVPSGPGMESQFTSPESRDV